MKKFTGLLVRSLLMLGITSCLSMMAANKITLVEDGKANSTIVIAADPTPAANLAAIEVQYFVEKMTGAKLPIVNDQKDVTGNKILIGESKLTKKLGLNVSKYHYMESLIKFYPDTVVILGRDDLKQACRTFKGAPSYITIDTASTIDYAKVNGLEGKTQKVFIPGKFDYQGTLRGAYRFLEDWCDVRFFGANPINIHIPKEKTLVVSGDEHHHRSGLDTKSGAMGVYGRSSGISEYGPHPGNQQVALYSRRIRWGGEPWYVNHTFEHFNYNNRFIKPVEPKNKNAKDYKGQLKKYEKNKKDFEKVIPGLKPTGRSHQFCYTTQGVIDQIVKDARNYFDGKMGDNVDHKVHDLQGRSDTFFLVPFDVGGYCKCKKCKPLLDAGRGRAATDFNTGESSDYVFALVNAVAKEVAKTHPDKHIGTLAYEGYYWTPKTFKMEKNVTMSPCVHTKFWNNSPKTHYANEFKWYKEWVKIAKEGKMGSMGMWNYDFDVQRCSTVYYAKKRGEYVKMFMKDGIRHIFHCGAPPMLEMYVSNQLYEKPELNTQDIIDDFFAKYFGPAAEPMKELQVLIEDYTSNPKHHPLSLQGGYIHDWLGLYEFFLTDEHLSKLRKLVNKAKELAPNEPYASRIKAWEKTMVMRYEKELFKHNAEKERVLREKLSAYKSTAKGYIPDVTATPAWHWYSGVKPEGLVDGQNMQEKKAGELGTKEARLNPAKGSFRWNNVVKATGAWILFDLGAEYELDEMAIWNYNDKAGNTQYGMKNIEIAYAENSEDLFNQKWIKLPDLTINKAQKNGKTGPDTVIDFKGKKVRYIYIHTLGGNGQGNWNVLEKTAKAEEKKEKNTLDAATGFGGTAFDDRKFSIGLGQVRFYGKALQLPKPELSIVAGKLKLGLPGYDKAEIRYTIDGTIPSKKSPLYKKPISVDTDVVIRAKAFGGGLMPSEYIPVQINIGDLVKKSAVRKKLTEKDLADIKGAIFAVELYDSDIGPYLKHLQINGATVVEVPASKKDKFDLNFINIPKDKLGSINPENNIKFDGGGADAYKLRNVVLYVQLKNGTWVKSETDSNIYCSQSKRNWVGSEGKVLNPIEMDIKF